MAYIHISKDRLEKAREKKEVLRAFFNLTNDRIIKCKVYGKNQKNAYVKLDGVKFPIRKDGNGSYNHWWII